MNYGQITRVVVPVVAAAATTAIVAPMIADALSTDAPPEPDPMPAPPDSDATDGAQLVEPAPAPEPEPAPAPEPAPVPAPAPEPAEPARRTYMNPVFDGNAPDPTVVRADDGNFYAYTTETDGLKFQVLKSKDLTSWKRVGSAFAGEGPAWIKEHRWAPDVKRTGDHYTMLYSGRGHDGQMKIGYATSKDAQGPFDDRGVLVEGNSGGYFIDPALVETPGGWKLLYGSTGGNSAADQTGISEVGVQIAADGSMKVGGDAKVVLSETGERYLVEGAWMHERDGSWYLFYSDGKWDAKGGADDYAVKVARADNPNGPFEKLGTPIMSQGGGFTSTGHNAIVTDDAGQDWMLYHGWSPDPSKGRVLLLDPITWKNGWPQVDQGKGPSNSAMVAPVIAAIDGADAVASSGS
jgi:arabinan endo-1,5-alpha-L-arabinosidase